MCGIVGMAIKANNGFSFKQETIINQLLYVGALRGEDSTGVIGVEKDSTFHIAKEATAAAWFQNSLAVDSKLGKTLFSRGKAFIGHNRKKTIGNADDESAHPFVVKDHFAVVHNGTLYNHQKLAKTSVDSEALAIVLEEAFGKTEKKESIETCLGRVDGAYALSIYDQRTHSVYLVRNADRPLSYIETPEGVFWASEAGMLWWVLSRNGIDCADITELPVDTLLTISLDDYSLSMEKLTIKKPSPLMTKMEGHITKGVKAIMGDILSKNRYKQLNRDIIGKKITWFPEKYTTDFIDGELGWLASGECHEFQFDHDVVAYIDNSSFSDTKETLCLGTVTSISRDRATGKITITVKNVTPYTKGNKDETVPSMQPKLTKEQQLEKSRSLSVFRGRVQGVANNADEHETAAV
jgi:predicted glutamine amidotransferase